MKKIKKIFLKDKIMPLDLFLDRVLYDKEVGYYQNKNPFGIEYFPSLDFLRFIMISSEIILIAIPVKKIINPRKNQTLNNQLEE